MTARTAMICARVLLALAALAAGALAFHLFTGSDAPLAPWVPLLHAAAFYGLALLAFAAFPNSRRSDLAFAIILLGGLLEAAAGASQRETLYHFGADVLGVLVLHLSSHLEQLRAAMRERPRAAAFRHHGDRRGRQATARGAPALVNAAAIGWVLAIGIAFATLCPVSLRPRLGDAQLERFGAYFLAAAAFVAAYPRRRFSIALGAATCAFGLEAGQLLVPSRDAHLADAATKAWGGGLGAYVAGMASDVWLRLNDRSARSRLAGANAEARVGSGRGSALDSSHAPSSDLAVRCRPTTA